MGQYYRAMNTETLEFLDSSDFGCGQKLTESSWVGNSYLGAVMALMSPGGKWYKMPIIWDGDYYGGDNGEINYYCISEEDGKDVFIKGIKKLSKEDQLKCKLVNHTKKEYVDYQDSPDRDGLIMNPLPLLTALGNGRGGGDYSSSNPNYAKIGPWAGNILSIETDDIPDDYKKVFYPFED